MPVVIDYCMNFGIKYHLLKDLYEKRCFYNQTGQPILGIVLKKIKDHIPKTLNQ